MVGYVIPLRPRATSTRWAKTRHLFRQTMESVLASTDPELRVFVVSHDLDRLEGLEDDRIEWIRADFPAPTSKAPEPSRRDRNWKVAAGCVAAAEAGVEWIFILDADDLVSPQLNGIIHGAKEYDAVQLDHGYEVHTRRRRAFRRRNLSQICGSTFAFRTEHIFVGGEITFWKCLNMTRNHKNFEEYLQQRGLRIHVPETPLIAYMLSHGENCSDAIRPRGFSAFVRSWIKFSLLGVSFDGALAAEFGFSPSG